MAKHTTTTTDDDPELRAALAAADDVERRMILAHEAKVHLGVSPEEVARLRPAIVQQAAAIATALRAEIRARRPR